MIHYTPITFDYLGLAYKASAYTVVIVIMQCQPYNFGAEIHINGGDTSTFVVH